MFYKSSKLQLILQAIGLESSSRRLASARNRFPIRGGTYGTYGIAGGSFGWTGVP